MILFLLTVGAWGFTLYRWWLESNSFEPLNVLAAAVLTLVSSWLFSQHGLDDKQILVYDKNLNDLHIDNDVIGLYEGESQDFKSTKNDLEPVAGTGHIEQFEITQNPFAVKIIGMSFDKVSKAQVSSWSGRLFKQDMDGTLYFGLELDQGDKEFGVLSFRRHGLNVRGWYRSGRVKTPFVYGYWAKKVTNHSRMA